MNFPKILCYIKSVNEVEAITKITILMHKRINSAIPENVLNVNDE